ncbi:MAG: selenocysteine-specific translation elongation factor [Chloroflexota bacterium]|nr:MAG: selenocysteine-specific translation elongation factor [Chloroflexota bacterium]
MTVVIGTAGHIDHGKTTLLRALTGIDADRLPEEQRRGMTIDIGYAHLDTEDGTSIDFVDVPGHDALIGNMLVGAGEIDAVMLVVAADDGPRAQTLEHLELVDALGLGTGIAVVTKSDLVDPDRTAAVVAETTDLLARTSLSGSRVLPVSAATGAGLADLRAGILALRDRIDAEQAVAAVGPGRLAVDRAFVVRGRGLVVTGSLRGGELRVGEGLRLEPGGAKVRIRGLHVHHGPVESAAPGRVAINLAGAELDDVRRGMVATWGAGIEATSRVLVALGRPPRLERPGSRASRPAWPPIDGTRIRIHLGTAQVDGVVGGRGRDAVELPDGRVTAIVRLAEPVATFVGDRGVARRPSPGDVVAGFEVLDPDPSRGASRRRATPERLAALAAAVGDADADSAADALVGLHGMLGVGRIEAVEAALGRSGGPVHTPGRDGLVVAPDIDAELSQAAITAITAFHATQSVEPGVPTGTIRQHLRTTLRRHATVRRDDAMAADRALDVVLEDLVRRGRLARDGDRLRDPSRATAMPPALRTAMDRLEVALDVPAPPDLAAAASAAGCPPEGVRALEAAGRIVRIEADLAWATPTFHRLAATALDIARREPLTPAALRDATGTSRRYVMPLIEDLNRRGILARTPTGHVPGPRAPRASRAPLEPDAPK